MDTSSNKILIIFLLVLVFYLLSLLSSILIPFVLAFLAASLFQPLVRFFKKSRVPSWVILPSVAVITLGILFLISIVIMQTYSEILSRQDYLVERLNEQYQQFSIWFSAFARDYLKTDLDLREIVASIDSKSLSNMAGNFASRVGSFASSFFMFALYYVVLLSGMSNYREFLNYVGGDMEDDSLLKTYENVQRSIISYIKVKTLISLITGCLIYLACLLFGVSFAFFWGFLAFLLNFIPTIGSVIAVLPPVLLGLIEFDSLLPVVGLLIVLVLIQQLMGSIIEPILMGNKLKLNTLTVIFGLVFWGYIWGIAGMMLSVPLMVILKLSFSNIQGFTAIARLMGSPDKKAPVSNGS